MAIRHMAARPIITNISQVAKTEPMLRATIGAEERPIMPATTTATGDRIPRQQRQHADEPESGSGVKHAHNSNNNGGQQRKAHTKAMGHASSTKKHKAQLGQTSAVGQEEVSEVPEEVSGAPEEVGGAQREVSGAPVEVSEANEQGDVGGSKKKTTASGHHHAAGRHRRGELKCLLL